MDAGRELQLDVARLAWTGDEGDVGRQRRLQQLKRVDQIRHDLLPLNDRNVHRRQERGDAFLTGAREDHQRSRLSDRTVAARDADVAGQE